ncbi:MAG: hypothetical protein KDB23_27230, partial [Planctomycetales bacterium]|nr:hypothetical protein [Planctomycetales bacterium]
IIGVLVGIPGTPEQKFELVYPRRTGGSVNATNGYEVDGICYQPQGGGNLQEWDHLIERVLPSSDLPGLPAGYEWQSARLTIPGNGNAGQGFMRIGLRVPTQQ